MRVPIAKDTLNCNKLAEEIVSSTTLNFISLFGWTTFQKKTLYVFILHFFNNRKQSTQLVKCIFCLLVHHCSGIDLVKTKIHMGNSLYLCSFRYSLIKRVQYYENL